MDVLKVLAVVVCLGGSAAFAGGEDHEVDPRIKIIKEQEKLLCGSTDEYVAALKFLRNTKEIVVPETTARLIAEKVAAGCDGAAERFSRVLLQLKSIGLSDRKSLQISLELASAPPDVQKNFTEIFSRAFLTEFFDYDYTLATRLALELSKDYKGDPAQVRDDFLELVRFCKEDKNLGLPNRMCAEFTIKLARLSQFYPEGVRRPFFTLFKELREKKEFSLDIKTALDISYNVLKNGPRAMGNFFDGYKYAMSKEGMSYDHRQAVKFAIKMADRSFVGTQPPIVPASGAISNAHP
jgi:hypothetical protein